MHAVDSLGRNKRRLVLLACVVGFVSLALLAVLFMVRNQVVVERNFVGWVVFHLDESQISVVDLQTGSEVRGKILRSDKDRAFTITDDWSSESGLRLLVAVFGADGQTVRRFLEVSLEPSAKSLKTVEIPIGGYSKGTSYPPTFGPGGRIVWIESQGASRWQLRLCNTDTGEIESRDLPAEFVGSRAPWIDQMPMPNWSPDRSHAAILDKDSSLFIYSTRDNSTIRLGSGFSVVWSPDSGRLAYDVATAPEMLYIWDVASGETAGVRVNGRVSNFDVEGWLPDSNKVIISTLGFLGELWPQEKLMVVDIKTGDSEPLAQSLKSRLDAPKFVRRIFVPELQRNSVVQ